MLFDALILVVKALAVFAALLVSVLFTIWLERRLVARMQTRIGPNRVGPGGILQSVADGIKLFFKEDVRPSNADRWLYWLAPVLMVVPAFLAFSVIPFGTSFGSEPAQLTDLNVGLLFVLAMASLQVYGVVLAGWSAGSNYPLLGGIRSSAQMVSYEIAQGLALVPVFMYAGSLSAADIVAAQHGDPYLGIFPRWFIIPQLPMFALFMIAALAETNRAPFDLPEAETELVGGYHTEYSGVKFALFFLAEYLNIITVSAVATTLFLGGPDGPAPAFLPWLWPMLWFVAKVFALVFVFVWLRATLPRLRYDRLMSFGWKVLIPVAFIWIAIVATIQVVELTRQTLLVAAAVVAAALLLSLLFPSREKPAAETATGGGSS